ncbi:MAG: SUMF1/EgtB/PvdO family nonheme iron enzyme, partial [Polyangiales bacterium]
MARVSALLPIALAATLATCAPHPELGEIELPPSRIAMIAEGFDQQAGQTVNLDDACPSGMVRVAGGYCPDVEHRCLRWLDPPGKYHEFRCAEYAKEPVCRAARTPMHFCIDRDEQKLTASSDPRPSNHVSYDDARTTCAARGARLCTQSEWQFACEGEEMRPYPYGFVRDSEACNIDHFELG